MNTSSSQSVANTSSPEGTPETSPALQCRVNAPSVVSPEGTAEPTPQSTNAVAQSKPAPHKHRPHRSKISILPAEIREFINQSLYDLTPRKQIIEELAKKGHPGINTVNLTKWSRSGYQLWLQERERFNCLQLKMDDADKHFHHLKADGQNRANYVNGILIDLHMAQIIRDFDPAAIKEQLQKDPMQFFKFVRATHTRSLDRQRDDRIKLLRKKFGVDVKTGPTEAGRQAVKELLNLPDCWIPPSNKPLTQISPN